MNKSVLDGLKPLTTKDGEPALCLVTGATGYIGGRLIPLLLQTGYRVRVLVRNAERIAAHPWGKNVEVVQGDALNQAALDAALRDVDVAYYLLHSLMSENDFHSEEQQMAKLFADTAKKNDVKRIVYLGGISHAENDLSEHMSARIKTGQILIQSEVPTIELRAGVVIGSGSASFEMLRYLTERLPVMITPKWLNNRIQPIAVRDVLRYLVGAAAIDPTTSGTFDIGGPDIFSYREMMIAYADAAGLSKRVIIPVPVLTPRLSSGWVGLVTPVPYRLARRLVESLKHEVVAAPSEIRNLIPDPQDGLTPFKEAVKLALTRIKEANVETRWTNASLPGSPSAPLPTDPDWSGGTLYKDIRTRISEDPIEEVWKRVEAIGGDNGYSRATWAWTLRGWMDKWVGGVGLRRGRRDPNHLIEGEALDFWRVEALDRPHLLRLRAEMKMPGLAWLEFDLEKTEGNKTKVTQRAIYAPKGLLGHLYWFSVWPMHGFVFPSMINQIATNKK